MIRTIPNRDSEYTNMNKNSRNALVNSMTMANTIVDRIETNRVSTTWKVKKLKRYAESWRPIIFMAARCLFSFSVAISVIVASIGGRVAKKKTRGTRFNIAIYIESLKYGSVSIGM